MTLGDIATKARNLTNTDISTYSDANLLIDVNIWLQKVVGMILDAQDESDWDDQLRTDYPIKKISLIALQRDYPIAVSEKMLKFRSLSISYDGINTYPADEVDLKDLPQLGDEFTGTTTQSSKIDNMFSRSAPSYDLKYNSIWIYPMAQTSDVASGAYMIAEWFRQALPFTAASYTSVMTDSTIVPGFDDTFHAILAYGAAHEYASPKGLPNLPDIDANLSDFEDRLRRQYSVKQGDEPKVFKQEYQNYK